MNDVLIMIIICTAAVEIGVIAFSTVLLWIGNMLIKMEEGRNDEGICK